MDEKSIRDLINHEKSRWLLWGIGDWREMVEATVDDEDGELFFYAVESAGETYPVEVVCGPNAEGGMEVDLTIIVEEGEWEPGASWVVHSDGRVEVIEETDDDLTEEGEDE